MLEPCPVCGEAPKWRGSASDYRAGLFRLQCLGETHLFQSYGATEAEAITAWNRRIPPASQSDDALVEELGQEIRNASRATVYPFELIHLPRINIYHAKWFARAILPIIDRERAAARREGIEEAAKAADDLSDNLHKEWREGHKSSTYLEGKSDGAEQAANRIRALGEKP